ncbi:protein BCAP-like [Pieris rapae]|uniref:protein BCAP-like n=1 Tax=Pieris rapae TaxID=64459 RepID=UPI001E27A028|nr:protein BCAP-like [Pieris rapae]
MLGIRTPPKCKQTAPAIRRSIDKWEAASSRAPEAAKEDPLAGAGGAGKSPAPAQAREREAKNCYLKAMAHLAESRNIKTEIKIGVQSAVKRLYQLIKEAEVELAGGPTKTSTKTSTKMTEGKDKETEIYNRLETQIERLEAENSKLEKFRKDIEDLAKKKDEGILTEIRKEFEEKEMKEKERQNIWEMQMKSYAEATKENLSQGKNSTEGPGHKPALHSVVVAPKNATDTAEETVQNIRHLLNAKEEGWQVQKIRKARDGKVVVGCRTEEERRKLKEKLSREMEVKDTSNKNPLVKITNLLTCNTTEDIARALKNQNKHVTAHLEERELNIVEKYRRKARNPLESHVVLQVTPKLWQALTSAGRIHVDLQREPFNSDKLGEQLKKMEKGILKTMEANAKKLEELREEISKNSDVSQEGTRKSKRQSKEIKEIKLMME